MSGRARLPLLPHTGPRSGPTLIGNQVVQVRQAGEERRLTPTRMVEALHGEELAVDGVVRLIQHGAHRRRL